jgi:class 3 adenylate cyclase
VAAITHGYVLATSNMWLGWTLPALYGCSAALALILLEMARVRSERTRVFDNLNSYLPDSVARDIAFSLPSSSIAAQRVNVTLLNADLRNFSRFGEARAPEEAAAMLHYFFTRATEIVEAHGGVLREFRGDGVLAIWRAADLQAAESALAAASALTVALEASLMPEPSLQGLEPLALGVSIEQGPVLVGSIGPAHRRTHTLLGDTVSITLRIQEMTAELAQPILIGECAARQLGNRGLVSQGSYLLSGLQTPHTLFAPAPSANVPKLFSASPSLSLVQGGGQS